jgi:murein DD-endopeptidase MepM/ murein hydrolase activator NlpD
MDEQKQNLSSETPEHPGDRLVAQNRETTAKDRNWKKTHQSATSLGLAISVGTAGILIPHQHQPATAIDTSVPKRILLDRPDFNQINPIQVEKSIPSLSIKPSSEKTQERSFDPWLSQSKPIDSIYDSVNRFWQEKQQDSLQQLQKKQQRLLNTLVEEQTGNSISSLNSLDFPGLTTKPHLLADLKLNKPTKQLNQSSQGDRIDSSIPLLESLPTTQVIPPTETIPISVNTTNPDSQKEQTLPLPSSLDISNPTLLTSVPIQIYQVQAGDTIDAIARRYRISKTEIIEINQIDNPSLLQIDDRLKIPVRDRTSFNSNIPFSVARFENNLQLSKSHLAKQKNLLNSNFPSNKAASSIRLAIPVQSLQLLNTDRVPSLAVNNLTGQIGERDRSSGDPYLAKLREDVLALQQEYQSQNNGVQLISSKSGESENNKSSTLLDPPSPEASAAILNKLNSSSVEKKLPLPIGGADPLPKSVTTSALLSNRRTSATSPLPQTLLSSALTTPNNYNPALKLPTDVLPELPPLSSPDRYLPGDRERFNGYMWPAKGKLSSGFGWRWGKMHKGIDIAGPVGTPVYAAASGEVVSAGWSSGGYGNLVKLKHSNGSITFYAHNSKVIVSTGQNIKQGQQIAEMGSTGFSTGSHLHFEIHPNGKSAVNPMTLLPKSREPKFR